MRIRRLAFLPIAFSLSFLSSTAFALPTCTVFSSRAQGLNGPLVRLKVWPGHDLSIMLPEDELVKDAIIGDPTQLVYGSLGGKLCPPTGGNQGEECNSTGAKLIYVRRIKKLQGFQLVPSADGSTDLKLVADGPEGTKQYQVGLIPMSRGTPSQCTTLRIVADPEQLPSILPPRPSSGNAPAPNRVPATTSSSQWQPPTSDASSQLPVKNSPLPSSVQASRTPQVLPKVEPQHAPTTVNSSTQALTDSQQATEDINAVRRGLKIAQSKKRINFGTAKWKQAQSAIRWLIRGESKESAAQKSGLQMPTLSQLIEWGQQHQ